MNLDNHHWQERLSVLVKKHGGVGASLAIAHRDATITAVAGVLNIRTGQAVTPDSLFQIGSITKVWTATLVMQLVDDGLVELDAPIINYLPHFKVADEQLTATVTIRQLLSHTSGIDGDLFLDTGRGDDALAKYVEAMAKLTRVIPPGQVMSYCNSGYNLLGHLIATLRGKTWEQVLQKRLLEPLGLDSAGTLPEEALLYGAATGHLYHVDTVEPTVTPKWGIFRSAGPAGLIHSTAEHQLALARLHLDDGVAADGTRLLSETSAKAMRVSQIDIPDRWTLGRHWGLGWIVDSWGDQPVYGHDGATLGQSAYLRVLPKAGLAISLLTNGCRASRVLYYELFSEIAQALAGVAPSSTPKARNDLQLDAARYVGTYRREGLDMVVEDDDEKLTLRMIPKSEIASVTTANLKFSLLPHSDSVMLLCVNGSESGVPVVFFDLDGERYLHTGARTVARVAT